MQASTHKTNKNGRSVMNQPAVKKEAAVSTTLQEWGQAPEVSSKMLMIPKIMVMQLTSKMVIEEKAAFGDFVSTLTSLPIGSYNKPIDIVPIFFYEMWAEFDLIKGERQFKAMIALTPENDNLPYKEDNIERDRIANIYCLLPGEVKTGGELPYIISFRSTSRVAAKKIVTQMYALNGSAGKSPAAKTFSLFGEKKTGKQGAWIQLDAKVVRDSTVLEETAALKWYKVIMAGQAKVAHDDVVEDVKGTKDVSDF